MNDSKEARSGTTSTTAIQIVERQLTADEAKALSLALRDTPNILGYRPAELQAIRSVFVAQTPEGECTGVCFLKYLPQNWADIAVIFVFPNHRKQGIGSALFETAMERLTTERRRILCVSREPSILRLMERANLRFIASSASLPFLVQLAYSRHYMSGYRFVEAFRKSARWPSEPPFRYAVSR